MTLGEALQSPQSRNLNTLRILLAIAVIVSHAWPLALGPTTREPLEHLTGRSLGGWAVGAFFFLSGLLITASAERRDFAYFWSARARRILPGLAVALVFTGALAVASGASATAQQLVEWYVRALTLVSIEHRLPGAFAQNPFPHVVNGPLWSLFHEVVAYVFCTAFVLAGGSRKKPMVIALVLATGAAAFAHEALPGRLSTFAPLFAAFSCGIAAHVFRDRINLSPWRAIAAITLALLLPWTIATGIVAGAIVALILCAPVLPPIKDVSYGMYIYGWPVAQAIVALVPGMRPEFLAIASVMATYPLAWMSWTLIERPGVTWQRVGV
ncbi:acyltransferase family protein [Shimia abyssi]|uniref:Peptidoglycan/LPS O-acetylase OafA/YrhL n=1 Tax=Shimia abyssi TaxID=1662395 RepID=A0A2P8FJT6_9RHOB|nr:acyltransferase [Shimia abyssi]PSL21970.1 peptidoglycan/LPS O-acetylase OafA/YrhL [Shimia abyssi]